MAESLRQQGYDVLRTREPGGTAIGDQIRHVLHDLKNEGMHPHAELLLFNASRAQIVAEIIRPHIEKGGIVICDRFFDSTLAYQGFGHGQNASVLRGIIDFATGGLRPDKTFYLNISAEEGLNRRLKAAAAGGEWTRMDAMAAAFHERVEAGYRHLIEAEPERWVVIDGTQTVEQVQAAIMEALTTYFEWKNSL